MPSALERTPSGATPAELPSDFDGNTAALTDKILHWLDEAKAEQLVKIDLAGKSPMGDFMVIASGNTTRHVGAIADLLQRKLKAEGHGRVRVEGNDTCDWVLIDTGDVIVHVFRPEVRDFYNLEKMWTADRPADTPQH